ncbi:hypothetical protein DB347_23915 [Opitutaceae bacterium EW11]|nr:hypothetical protein DB347_23915 [Opitutaceae bacterium EW11]
MSAAASHSSSGYPSSDRSGQPDLTIAHAATWRAILLEVVKSGGVPTLDLGAVEACDTIGVQLLRSAAVTARKAGTPLRIVRAAPCVIEACDKTGIRPSDIALDLPPKP